MPKKRRFGEGVASAPRAGRPPRKSGDFSGGGKRTSWGSGAGVPAAGLSPPVQSASTAMSGEKDDNISAALDNQGFQFGHFFHRVAHALAAKAAVLDSAV